MGDDRLHAAVPDGEALRYHSATRGSGHVGLTDDRLLIVDSDVVSVPLENVESIDIRSFDWFLVVMSVAIVLFGLASLTINVLGAVAFVAVGVVSLVLTYRKRGKVTINTHAQAKPLTLYLDETEEFSQHVERTVNRFEAHRDAEG